MIASMYDKKSGYWAVYDVSEYGWSKMEPLSAWYLTKAEADEQALLITGDRE